MGVDIERKKIFFRPTNRIATAKAPQMRSLVEHLRAQVPEFRRHSSLAYPIAGFLALIALAMFSGVRRGPQDLAEYAATLSQGQLRALGFRIQRGTGRIRCPGESTFKRVLPQVDASAVERALLLWQEQVLGPSQDKLVIVDGKTLRHAHVELVSAVNGSGRWLGTVAVPETSNEIPAAREQLGKVELNGKTVLALWNSSGLAVRIGRCLYSTGLADALHTQVETVQQILFEGGGDYVLTVKGNQKELVQTLATLLTPGKFSPSTHGEDARADTRSQSEPAGNSAPGMPGGHPGASEFSRRATDCAAAAASAAQRQKEHRDGVFDQQPDLGTIGRAGLDQTQARLLGD